MGFYRKACLEACDRDLEMNAEGVLTPATCTTSIVLWRQRDRETDEGARDTGITKGGLSERQRDACISNGEKGFLEV